MLFSPPRCSKLFKVSRLLGFVAFSLAISLVALPAATASRAAVEIKLATLAPENSTLMRIFREMDQALAAATDGRVRFKIYSGFVLGDERDVLRKMRIGLVHAATFTSTSLTDVNPELRVLQVPFLFRDYHEVDHVLRAFDQHFRAGFRARGFEVLGWSELGFIYLMSTAPIARVSDLDGKKVWTRAHSPMANAVFARAGVSPVTIGAPDVLVALETGLVEVVYNSPYYALITQWYSRIQYLTDLPLAYVGGALIMNSRSFNRLSPEDQDTLKQVCADYMRRLTVKTRDDNAKALQLILQRGVKKVSPPPGEVERFKGLLAEALADMKADALPRDLLERVEKELATYRGR